MCYVALQHDRLGEADLAADIRARYPDASTPDHAAGAGGTDPADDP